MHQRARRILLAAPTAPDPVGPDPKRSGESRSRPRQQTIATIMFSWQRMTTKLCLVLRTFHHKEIATKLLGKEAFLRIFRDIKYIKSERTEEHPTVWRIIDGFTVEEPMKPSTTKPARLPAADCHHPTGQMQHRGNGFKGWFTCLACNSRWVSHSVGYHTPMGNPTPEELVMFGKHKGKTFRWVTTNDENYCKWIVKAAEEEPESGEPLRRLARYLVTLESQEADRRSRMDTSTRSKRPQPESSCPAAPPRSSRANPDDLLDDLTSGATTPISSVDWSEVRPDLSSGSEWESNGPLFQGTKGGKKPR